MIYLYIAMIFIFFGCDSVGNKKIYKSFDIIDGLMVCSLSQLKYLLTDLGILKKIDNK